MNWHIGHMAKLIPALLLMIFLAVPALYAAQSTITETEGYACMGDDKSRKQTEQAAMSDAKRKATESALTHLKSETQVKNFTLEKDLISAYTDAQVRVLQEMGKGWYKDASSGDCYLVKIKAEVIPNEKAIERISQEKGTADDPSAPLSVQVWSDKKAYKHKEKIRIYLKGNKPFYAKVVYKDASGALIQLLPNPYRQNNYFQGGAIYDIPSGEDRFDLEVGPPFGEESIVIYTSTSQLGDLSLESNGGVYQIKTEASSIGTLTRGVKLKGREERKEETASEFFEEKVLVKTGM